MLAAPARIACFAALFLLPLALADAADARADLHAASCTRDITPISPSLAPAYAAAFGTAPSVNHSDPVWLAGFGDGRAATGYHDRLWARGVVVEARGGRVAIVALDLVGYFHNEVETIRGLLSPASGIDYLVVHSTHQHEGPDTLGIWGPSPFVSGIDFAYLDFVNQAVADCVDEAAANLKRARVRFATTDTAGLSLATDPEDDGFGVGDGKVLAGDAALAPATGGRIVDPRLVVMQLLARGADGKQGKGPARQDRVLATLVNFGSHPESLGSSNTLVTSDFPHFVRERLEAEYGGTAIWVSGALGVLQGPLDIDVLDPDTGLAAPRRTFRFAEVHGTQLAERAIAAIAALPANERRGEVTPRIAFESVNPVAVQVDNPYFRFFFATGVLSPRRALFTNGTPDGSVGFPFPPPFDVIPQALGADVQTEVGALRIGRGSFAVVPTEVDPQISDGYRARMEGAAHTFVIGLGNDEIGYQLPKPKWDDSCHACAPFVLGGAAAFCPIQPIDCNTVFQNNVGREVDPAISGAIEPLLDALHP